jgi:hypothetical protein
MFDWYCKAREIKQKILIENMVVAILSGTNKK